MLCTEKCCGRRLKKKKFGVYEAFFAIRSVQMSFWWRLQGRNGSFWCAFYPLRCRQRRKKRNLSTNYELGSSKNSKLTNKLIFVVVGARDFSPEITVLPIGTEVPCSDRVPPQILIYRALHANIGTRTIILRRFSGAQKTAPGSGGSRGGEWFYGRAGITPGRRHRQSRQPQGLRRLLLPRRRWPGGGGRPR